jgi:hypothetical protein
MRYAAEHRPDTSTLRRSVRRRGRRPAGRHVRARFAAAYRATAAPLTEGLGAKLAQQGKMYVRDRIAQLFDEGSFVEDGRYANALAGDLPADGVVTGPRDGRRPAGDRHRQRPDRQGRLVGCAHGREDRPGHRDGHCARSCRSSGSSTRPARGSPTRSRCSRGAGEPGGSSTTRSRCPARCRRSAACSARRLRRGAYIPSFCDIIVMVEGNASMYLGSPRMAEMVVGEKGQPRGDGRRPDALHRLRGR